MTTAQIIDEIPTHLQPGDPAAWSPMQRTRNERMAQYLRALHAEGTLTAASARTGIGIPTVWRWRGEFPSFGDAVNQFLTRDRQSIIEDNLYRIATSTDPKIANATVKASEIYLKALDRDKYGDKQQIEQTVTINHMVQDAQTVKAQFRALQQQKLQQIKTLDALPLSDDPNPETS